MMASFWTEPNGKPWGLGVVCKSTPGAMKVLGVDKKHNGQSKLMQMHDSLLSDMVPASTSRTGKPVISDSSLPPMSKLTPIWEIFYKQHTLIWVCQHG